MTIPLLLKPHQVPWLWLIWPEDHALIAHRLDGNTYRVIATMKNLERCTVRTPPFDAMELDLAQLLGCA